MWMHISEVADVVVGGIAARAFADASRQWIGFRPVQIPANDNAPWYLVARERAGGVRTAVNGHHPTEARGGGAHFGS